MKSTNFPQFVLLLAVLLFSNTLNSQKKQVIILINSQPVLVEIDADGNIKNILETIPKKESKKTQVKPDTSDVPDSLIKKTNINNPPKSYSFPTSTKNNEFILVPFESGYATLNDKSISLLDKIIAEFKRNDNQSLLVQALSSDTNLILLNNNRLNSVKTYFRIRGLDVSKVRCEILQGDVDIDEIKVSYIKY